MLEPSLANNAKEFAQLARVHQLTAYDAAYLSLAIEAGQPLYTHDKNLAQAAKRAGVPLFAND